MSYNYKYLYFPMISILRLTQASQLSQHLRRNISGPRDNSAGKCLGTTAKTTSADDTREGRRSTNIAIPVENFGTTGISLPCSSRALRTEKAASKFVIAIQSAASARCRPTLIHIFNEKQRVRIDTDAHHIRRPKPKHNGIVSLLRDPSSWRNLSGLNSSGLGYFFSLCAIALEISC